MQVEDMSPEQREDAAELARTYVIKTEEAREARKISLFHGRAPGLLASMAYYELRSKYGIDADDDTEALQELGVQPLTPA